jgi:futalosine hydrolase
MYCLVVAATNFEIAPLIEAFREKRLYGFQATEFAFGITGVGLTATTYWLTKRVRNRRPDLVIQAGIAGCFDKDIQLGSVMAVEKDTIADQVVIESGEMKTLFDLGLLPEDEMPYENGWLVNTGNLIRASKLPRVKAITTNEITSATGRIELYRQKYDPKLESLEGAALHYVALNENIDFLQIRSVSNYIGERDKEKWRLKESIAALNNTVAELLESL